MFAKCFARIILQYVPEGSGSWKYNHYFPVAKGKGKMYDYIGNGGDRGSETRLTSASSNPS